MSLSIRCPQCKLAMSVPDTQAGHAVGCIGCGELVRVPGPPAAVVMPLPPSPLPPPPPDPPPADPNPFELPPRTKRSRRPQPEQAGDSGMNTLLLGVIATAAILIVGFVLFEWIDGVRANQIEDEIRIYRSRISILTPEEERRWDNLASEYDAIQRRHPHWRRR